MFLISIKEICSNFRTTYIKEESWHLSAIGQSFSNISKGTELPAALISSSKLLFWPFQKGQN